jgi:hypothetical protein
LRHSRFGNPHPRPGFPLPQAAPHGRLLVYIKIIPFILYFVFSLLLTLLFPGFERSNPPILFLQPNSAEIAQARRCWNRLKMSRVVHQDRDAGPVPPPGAQRIDIKVHFPGSGGSDGIGTQIEGCSKWAGISLSQGFSSKRSHLSGEKEEEEKCAGDLLGKRRL